MRRALLCGCDGLIAVGGGGLIAGSLAWLGGRRKVVGVEPVLAPTLHRFAQAAGPGFAYEEVGQLHVARNVGCKADHQRRTSRSRS